MKKHPKWQLGASTRKIVEGVDQRGPASAD